MLLHFFIACRLFYCFRVVYSKYKRRKECMLMLERLFDISKLQDELNPSVFTWNSVEGVLLILFLAGLGLCFANKLRKFLMTGFMLVVFIELCHIFAMSSVGSNIPVLQTIFAYDVIQSLAQLCVGTPLCTFFLYLQAFLNNTFGQAIEIAWQLFWFVWDIIGDNLSATWHMFFD